MKKLSIIALLALAAFPAGAQQDKRMPTGDEYMANEVATKALLNKQILDELAKAKADLAKSEAELAKLKTPDADKAKAPAAK